MTLWTFGDSFSYDIKFLEDSNVVRQAGKYPNFIPLKDNWVNLVAKKLGNNVKQINDSEAGCANEYIFYKFKQRLQEFKEGDCVIICLTSANRRWLIERSPHLANWSHCNFDPDNDNVTEKERVAVTEYAKHLYSDTASYAIYDAILWATIHAAEELELLGVKVLILPGFERVPGVNGTLKDVCYNEFDGKKTIDKFYTKTNDNRWNHLNEVNHKILADKVCKFFTNFEMVDLTNNFEKNIYTKNNIQNFI